MDGEKGKCDFPSHFNPSASNCIIFLLPSSSSEGFFLSVSSVSFISLLTSQIFCVLSKRLPTLFPSLPIVGSVGEIQPWFPWVLTLQALCTFRLFLPFAVILSTF